MSKFKGIQIVPRPNEDPDRMIKRFTKKVRESKILEEFRSKQFYEKPSVKRRRKHSMAVWKANHLEE